MMRVIVEIHPRGNASEKREVARFDVCNIGPAGVDIADYQADGFFENGRRWRGLVFGHRREHGWADLARRVLKVFLATDTPSHGSEVK